MKEITEEQAREALRQMFDGITTFDSRKQHYLLSSLITRHFLMEKALKEIKEWDCLNPPQTNLCTDFTWLKKLVDQALTGKGEGK